MDDNGNVTLDLLDELLERERQILKQGLIDSLPELAEHKERLLRALPGAGGPALDRLRASFARNGRLLAASAQGLTDAGNRLRQLTAAPELMTYDGKGEKRSIGPAAPSVNRNA